MPSRTFAAEYRFNILNVEATRRAFIVDDHFITFGELRTNIAHFRRSLSAIDVRNGSTIAVSLSNSPELLYIAFAAAELGACLVPVHPATPPAFTARILAFCRVSHLVVQNDVAAARLADLPCKAISVDALFAAGNGVSDPPDVTPSPASTAVIITTSGTTAQPKFVPISQENFATIIDASKAVLSPLEDLKKGVSYIMLFPLSSSGILPAMAQIALGCTTVLTDDVSLQNVLSLIDRHKLDGIQCPPPYLEGLVRFPRFDQYDVTSITRLNSGSDFVSGKVLIALKDRFPNLRQAGIGYGLAETSAIVATWNAACPSDFEKPTNRFRLVNPAENELRIVDSEGKPTLFGEKGEVWIRGKSVIKEYFQDEALTRTQFTDDGWMRTGDVGILEDARTLQLLGRNKYTIKRGGRSISPVTVSDALETHPAVEKACVVGVPHPLFGEMIWAFVRRLPDARVSEGDLNALCRTALPPYYKPDNIVFLDEIPRTRVGKVDYESLKSLGISMLNEMTGENDEFTN